MLNEQPQPGGRDSTVRGTRNDAAVTYRGLVAADGVGTAPGGQARHTISLREIDLQTTQHVEHHLALDALGTALDSCGAARSRAGLHGAAIDRVVLDVLHQLAVDLEDVDRQRLECSGTRTTCRQGRRAPRGSPRMEPSTLARPEIASVCDRPVSSHTQSTHPATSHIHVRLTRISPGITAMPQHSTGPRPLTPHTRMARREVAQCPVGIRRHQVGQHHTVTCTAQRLTRSGPAIRRTVRPRAVTAVAMQRYRPR